MFTQNEEIIENLMKNLKAIEKQLYQISLVQHTLLLKVSQID